MLTNRRLDEIKKSAAHMPHDHSKMLIDELISEVDFLRSLRKCETGCYGQEFTEQEKEKTELINEIDRLEASIASGECCKGARSGGKE